jgi:photosystem II CP47 chlorophyll apoprotein
MVFAVILIDERGSLRADIALRRAESRYSMEQTHVLVSFSGGILNATEYSTPSLVKDYARKAQFGQILTFAICILCLHDISLLLIKRQLQLMVF